MLFLYFFLFFTGVFGQSWYVQRHYPAAGCSGNPFIEASGNLGMGACTVDSPCQLTASDPTDYTLVECVGSSPSVTIKDPVIAEAYSTGTCNPGTLTSLVAYVANTCVTVGSSSLRVTCSATAAVRTDYSDPNCATYSKNTSFGTGVEGQCLPLGAGGTIFRCGSTILSMAAPVVMTMVMLMWLIA